jgi:hypothetical protein
VIERIFGVLKRRFRILIIPPEYDMDVQARLPAALAALHNFIRGADPSEINEFVDEFDEETPDSQPGGQPSTGELADGLPRAAEKRRADARQRAIANAMWEDYQRELRRRGMV